MSLVPGQGPPATLRKRWRSAENRLRRTFGQLLLERPGYTATTSRPPPHRY